MRKLLTRTAMLYLGLGLLAINAAFAQEAVIRTRLQERFPGLGKIDEVSKSPIAGLYEVRIGHDIFYSDGQGNYLVQGTIIDTRTRADLTQARIAKLSAIDFSTLPLRDSIVWKQGSGARKLVVFADPNCGYCKRFERELPALQDATIYLFLYPILGSDSIERSQNIWCAADPAKAWRDWMLDGRVPPATTGSCDTSALDRVAALGRKHRVTGTPTLVLESGQRVVGAVSGGELQRHLNAPTQAPQRKQ